ncbi:MAG: murein L,D-transpeptidase catalytic domain family protein [Flavobacteriaceae bacterium]|jgi:hypothetical protein|nr:murein L,D-transpeptidase catalytic domain family protein [Flavobacteriaceae bacterium]
MNYKYLSMAFLVFAIASASVSKNIIDLNENEKIEHSAPEEKVENKVVTFEQKAFSLYSQLNLNKFNAPPKDIFAKALKGYYKMQEEGIIKNEKLTIVDFSVSSAKERLWVIDMATNEIILQSLVAHGKKTGEEYATKFSNRIDSHQSSLGFYVTGETYNGSNGFSMRLDGLEKGFNDNARTRAIVVHGADYASPRLVQSQGKLGRSYGCPAVPASVNAKLINLIKDESCLFIYYPSQDYMSRSSFLI